MVYGQVSSKQSKECSECVLENSSRLGWSGRLPKERRICRGLERGKGSRDGHGDNRMGEIS